MIARLIRSRRVWIAVVTLFITALQTANPAITQQFVTAFQTFALALIAAFTIEDSATALGPK
jgi:hypothetical protein